ncbi:reticulon-3 isoform X1 [Amia ocellicauda]|uniref:reticulon-3 isoform X1 n=1 Tax=Amia ocellicauda TaxID=2972642 RepID=UPI0034640841
MEIRGAASPPDFTQAISEQERPGGRAGSWDDGGFLLFKERHYERSPVDAPPPPPAFTTAPSEASPDQDSPESPFEVLGDARARGDRFGSEFEDTADWMRAHLPPTPEIQTRSGLQPELSAAAGAEPVQTHEPAIPEPLVEPQASTGIGALPAKSDSQTVEQKKQASEDEEAGFDLRFLPTAYMWDKPEKPQEDIQGPPSATKPPTSSPVPAPSPPPSVPPRPVPAAPQDAALLWGADPEPAETADADSSGESDDTVIEDPAALPGPAPPPSYGPAPPGRMKLDKLILVPVINVIETGEQVISEEEEEGDYEVVKDPVKETRESPVAKPEPVMSESLADKASAAHPVEPKLPEQAPPLMPKDSPPPTACIASGAQKTEPGRPSTAEPKTQQPQEEPRPFPADCSPALPPQQPLPSTAETPPEKPTPESLDATQNTSARPSLPDPFDVKEATPQSPPTMGKPLTELLQAGGDEQEVAQDSRAPSAPSPADGGPDLQKPDSTLPTYTSFEPLPETGTVLGGRPAGAASADWEEKEVEGPGPVAEAQQAAPKPVGGQPSPRAFPPDPFSYLQDLHPPPVAPTKDTSPAEQKEDIALQAATAEKPQGDAGSGDGRGRVPAVVEVKPQPGQDSPETVSDPESVEPECSVSAATDSFVDFMRECLKSRQDEGPEDLPAKPKAPTSAPPPTTVLDLEQERLTICALKELGDSLEEDEREEKRKEDERVGEILSPKMEEPEKVPPPALAETDPQSVAPPPASEKPLPRTPPSGEVERAAEGEREPAPLAGHVVVALLTHTPVRDLVYWRDPKKSGVVFGVSLLLLLSLAAFSVISVASYLLLALLCVTISFRIYKSVIQAVQKSSEGHPFKAYMESEVSISPESFRRHVDVTLSHVNCVLKQMSRLFLVEDLVDSLKLAVLMWLMTYVGAVFNGITLLIMADILMFSLPVVYEKYKTQIDHYVGLVRGHVKNAVSKVQEKIPGAVKRKAE